MRYLYSIFFVLILCTACTPVVPAPIITPEPTRTVVVTVKDLPTIYYLLSDKLGIPPDELRVMTDEQITQLIEQNAAALGITSYDYESGVTINATPSDAALCTIVRRAVGFLSAQYDPALYLLHESPITAPDKYWLATDNRLALAALRKAVPCAPDASQLAMSITQGLVAYGDDTQHGLIEAVIGGEVEWLPRTPTQTEVAPGIWREERLTGAIMDDWREYADLALIGVMHMTQSGQTADARALYADTLVMFDGTGFVDKANGNEQPYATYKLALALLAANVVGKPLDTHMLAALLDKQDASGGFFALYDGDSGLNDANTETTAYSILALMTTLPTLGNP